MTRQLLGVLQGVGGVETVIYTLLLAVVHLLVDRLVGTVLGFGLRTVSQVRTFVGPHPGLPVDALLVLHDSYPAVEGTLGVRVCSGV